MTPFYYYYYLDGKCLRAEAIKSFYFKLYVHKTATSVFWQNWQLHSAAATQRNNPNPYSTATHISFLATFWTGYQSKEKCSANISLQAK